MQYIQLQGQVAAGLDTPIAGGFNLFVDTADNTIKIKDSEGNLTGSGISLIEVTRAELLTAIEDGALIPGAFYKISGVATGSSEIFLQEGGTTIILQAITSSLITSKGFGLFWNPNYDTTDVWDNKFNLQMNAGVTGPFFDMEETLMCDAPSNVVLRPNVFGTSAIVTLTDYTASSFFTDPANYPIPFTSDNTGISGDFISANYTAAYAPGDFAIWGGRVWGNLSGNIGNAVNDFELNEEDWQLVPFAAGPRYSLVVDEIEYDLDNNHISYRRDAAKNISVTYRYSSSGTSGIKRFPWGHLDIQNVSLENTETDRLVNFHNTNSINGLQMKEGSRFEAGYWGRYNDFNDIYGDIDSDIENLRLGNGSGFNNIRLGINSTMGGADPIWISNNDGDDAFYNLTLENDAEIYGIEFYQDARISDCVLSNGSRINNMVMYNNSYLSDITLMSNSSVNYITMGSGSHISNVKLDEDAYLGNLNLDNYSYVENISLGISSNIEYSSVGESCYITDVNLGIDSSINCTTLSRQDSYSPYIERISLGSSSWMSNINLSSNTYISSVKSSDDTGIGQITISGASGGHISDFEIEQSGGFGSFTIDASAGSAYLENFKIGQNSGFGSIPDITTAVAFRTISREFNNFEANNFTAGVTGSLGWADVGTMTQLDPYKSFHILDTTGWDGNTNSLNYYLPNGEWEGQTVKFFATGDGTNMGDMGGIRIWCHLGTPYNITDAGGNYDWHPFTRYDLGAQTSYMRTDVPTAIWINGKWVIDNDNWD